MADEKITALTAATDAAATDQLVIVDVSDTSQAASGTTKKIEKDTLLNKGTLAANSPEKVTQVWNNAGVNFTALQVNVTDTASGGASRIVEWRVGGSALSYINKDGSAQFAQRVDSGAFVAGSLAILSQSSGLTIDSKINIVPTSWDGVGGIKMGSGVIFSWSDNAAVASGTRDAGMARTSAGLIEFNNGTAGTLRDWKSRRGSLSEYQDILVSTEPAAPSTGASKWIETGADLHSVTSNLNVVPNFGTGTIGESADKWDNGFFELLTVASTFNIGGSGTGITGSELETLSDG